MELTQEDFNELIHYDASTGKMFWKNRPLKWFLRYTNPKASCARWNGRNAGKEAFYAINEFGYLIGTLFRENYKAHRVAWFISHGEWPEQIDHINGIREDNRLCNLRPSDSKSNAKNKMRPSNNTSGHIGVHWDKSNEKWRASIMVGRKQMHIGRYENLEEAVKARKEADEFYGFDPDHGKDIGKFYPL